MCSFHFNIQARQIIWYFIVTIGERQLLMCLGIFWKSRVICHLQALEDEFTRKLQEQEVFFKMTGDSECLNPSAQSRISKFYPIPSVHPSSFWKKHLHTELCTDTQCESWVSAALSPFFVFLNCDFTQWWLLKKQAFTSVPPEWRISLFNLQWLFFYNYTVPVEFALPSNLYLIFTIQFLSVW